MMLGVKGLYREDKCQGIQGMFPPKVDDCVEI